MYSLYLCRVPIILCMIPRLITFTVLSAAPSSSSSISTPSAIVCTVVISTWLLTEQNCFLVYKWTLNGIFASEIRQSSNVWGIVGLACLEVLAIFSIPPIRRRFYTVFLGSHIVAFIVFLPAVRSSSSSIHGWLLNRKQTLGCDTQLCYDTLCPRCARHIHCRSCYPSAQRSYHHCSYQSHPRALCHTCRDPWSKRWMEGRSARPSPRLLLEDGGTWMERSPSIHHRQRLRVGRGDGSHVQKGG